MELEEKKQEEKEEAKEEMEFEKEKKEEKREETSSLDDSEESIELDDKETEDKGNTADLSSEEQKEDSEEEIELKAANKEMEEEEELGEKITEGLPTTLSCEEIEAKETFLKNELAKLAEQKKLLKEFKLKQKQEPVQEIVKNLKKKTGSPRGFRREVETLWSSSATHRKYWYPKESRHSRSKMAKRRQDEWRPRSRK
jgi:hypothetical protein